MAIKILFNRSQKAFLPEINAYISYFNSFEEFQAFDSSKIKGCIDYKNYDIIWEFMGFNRRKYPDSIVIHDYASLSVGFLPKVKNYIKVKWNNKPDLRIFLNNNVKEGFDFKDDIEYIYRDMGINEVFFNQNNKNKEYDYVYIGPVNKERGIHLLLRNFCDKQNGSICLIGNVESDIYEKYNKNSNIIFTGVVTNKEVSEIASKAVYGINYIPNKYPYNIQTSTKILEYLALDLKILTTDYHWVNSFERKYGHKFYRILNSNIDKLSVDNFRFINKDVSSYRWGNIMVNSGIKEKIIDLHLKKRGAIL